MTGGEPAGLDLHRGADTPPEGTTIATTAQDRLLAGSMIRTRVRRAEIGLHRRGNEIPLPPEAAQLARIATTSHALGLTGTQ